MKLEIEVKVQIFMGFEFYVEKIEFNVGESQ